MPDKYGYSKIEIETAHRNITKESVLSYILSFQGDRATLQEIFDDFILLEVARAEVALLASLRKNSEDHSKSKVEIAKAFEAAEATSDKIVVRLDSTIPKTRL